MLQNCVPAFYFCLQTNLRNVCLNFVLLATLVFFISVVLLSFLQERARLISGMSDRSKTMLNELEQSLTGKVGIILAVMASSLVQHKVMKTKCIWFHLCSLN